MYGEPIADPVASHYSNVDRSPLTLLDCITMQLVYGGSGEAGALSDVWIFNIGQVRARLEVWYPDASKHSWFLKGSGKPHFLTHPPHTISPHISHIPNRRHGATHPPLVPPRLPARCTVAA